MREPHAPGGPHAPAAVFPAALDHAARLLADPLQPRGTFAARLECRSREAWELSEEILALIRS